MVLLDEEQRLNLENALLVGMTLEEACFYARLSPSQLDEFTHDDEELENARALSASLEYSLLSRMMHVSSKQASQGQERATVWLLEKLYPRFSSKPEAEGGAIHLHINTDSLEEMDNVDVVIPDPNDEL